MAKQPVSYEVDKTFLWDHPTAKPPSGDEIWTAHLFVTEVYANGQRKRVIVSLSGIGEDGASDRIAEYVERQNVELLDIDQTATQAVARKKQVH